MASQITSLTSVYSTVYSGSDQSKHQSSASLAFVWGIHRGPVNSPHKWPVTRKMFPFDDVIMLHFRESFVKFKHFPFGRPNEFGEIETVLTLSQCTLVGPVYTGMPLECHWLTQCTLGYHWATQRILAGYTGTPLKKLS